MPLTPGTSLGPYQITASIGAGGMGEVYRARDTQLNRDVAIKVLPELFAQDAERLARFTREAQTLASLNHPHIAQIFGLAEGALVMELVEGDDLSVLIARGPMPLADALPIARQIADALEAAHEQGIIHRDLKPANVKVRPDGTVKVLDFGLAKALSPEGSFANDPVTGRFTNRPYIENSPTITSPATQMGMIIGTAAYMAPEQAKGRAVDRRADIWAFGVVLYEMLTGGRAFKGDDISDVLAAVLKTEPDWTALPAGTPPSVRRLLRRCLEKDPRKRLSAIGDARLELDDVGADPASREAGHDVPAPRRQAAVIALAAISAILVLLSGYLAWRQSGPNAAASSVRFAVQPPAGLDLQLSDWPVVVLSPDGSRLLITAANSAGQDHIYLRPLDSVEMKVIDGTKGGFNPFFSTDGKWMAFTADQKLKMLPVTGGQPQILTDADWGGGTWGPDGTIVYTKHYTSGLWKVPAAAGGKPEKLTDPDTAAGELGHWWPQFLPDGKHVVFTSFSTPVEKSRVMVYAMATGTQRVLVEGANFPRVLASGHLLYARANGIAGVPFDLGRAEITGPETPVLDGVSTYFTNGLAQLAVADNGTMAFVPEKEGRVNSEVVWLDRKGTMTPAIPAERRITDMKLSPDGRRVALTIDNENRDVWVYEFARGIFGRVTAGPASEFNPRWMPDGLRLLFASERPVFQIFMKPPIGTAPDEPVVTENVDTVPMAVSPDGKYLVHTMSNPSMQTDVWIRPLDGQGKARALLASKYDEADAALSPDGTWIAYTSDESGRPEAYIQAFPEPAERWQVSTNGAVGLRWGRDGKELFYATGEPERLMAVPLAFGTGGSISSGKPVVVYEGRFLDYDTAPGGRLLLMLRDPKAPAPSIHVVLNWFEALKGKFASR
ncbi:MAG: protein kinase [Vicinamibacterales bacterium]